MKGRKAQVTMFILVGIILLFALIFLIYITTTYSRMTEVMIDDSEGLKNYVTSCIDHVSSYGLFKIGRQGGYIDPPENHYLKSYATLSYGYYNNRNIFPTIEFIQSELENYISGNLPACLNAFDIFKNQGITVESDQITSEVLFTVDETIVRVNYPLMLIEGSKKTKVSDFSARFPVRMRHIQSIGNEISERKTRNPGYVDLTYLGDVEANTTVLTYKDGTQVFVIEDPKSELEHRSYRFMFASELV